MRYLALVTFILLIFVGCNTQTAIDKYQIIASPDGNVYRLDKSSGEVWLIKDGTMEEIQAKSFRLKINQHYIAEDLYSFVYLGKGQLGDVKTLDDIMKKKYGLE